MILNVSESDPKINLPSTIKENKNINIYMILNVSESDPKINLPSTIKENKLYKWS